MRSSAEQVARLGVALLAAGASSRMGKPKLLLPWGDGTVLSHLIRTWTQLGAEQILVVWSRSAPGVPDEVARLNSSRSFLLENPAPEAGMWSSIQCAASWTGWDDAVTHFVVVLGDQPHVCAATLKHFFNRIDYESPAAWQPSVGQQRAHPVVLARSLWEQIPSHKGPRLKDFLARHEAQLRLIPMNDAALLRDIDSPADWDELSAGELPGAREK